MGGSELVDMAVRWTRWLAGASLMACVVSTTPAHAQGFLQNLFNWGSASPKPMAPSPFATTPHGYREPLYDPYKRDQHRSDDTFLGLRGSVRTLCVRLCDGYYWPISQATSGSGLERDAVTCRSSCGQEARLFFHGSNSGDVSDMIDLLGRPYTALPTAFRYRKKLVDSCRCKPEPWSASERDRHRHYAQTAPAPDSIESMVKFSGPPVPPLRPQDRVRFDYHKDAMAPVDREIPADSEDRPAVAGPHAPAWELDARAAYPRKSRDQAPALKMAPRPPAVSLPLPPPVRAPIGTNGPLSDRAWPSG